MENTKSSRLLFIFVISLIFFLLCIPINGQVAQGIGANTENPKEILLAAEQAVARVRSVTYDATHHGTGAFSTRSSSSNGTMKLIKLEIGNPLTAKVAAKGKFYSAGKADAEPFHAVFTGTAVLSLNSQKKIMMRQTLANNDPKERDFGYITQRLGGATAQLIMYEYLLAKPFEKQTAAEVLEYEGRAGLDGVLCHVVYTEFDRRPDGRVRRERWYIGIKDSLPRKFETVVADDKGRSGAYVLTLSNLRADVLLAPRDFSIQLPKGYEIKDYEAPKRPVPLTVGDSAPEWALADATGKTHSLSDYRGKVVVLDFWSTWCGPCVKTMPDIQALHEKFKGRGVEVIGVNSWEESNAAAYFKEKGYTYGLLLNGEKITKEYRVINMPMV